MYLTRKARCVAIGSKTELPDTLTYSIVVSRESVRIEFLITVLNDLDVMACYIDNAYLNATCREKIFSKAGTECSEN